MCEQRWEKYSIDIKIAQTNAVLSQHTQVRSVGGVGLVGGTKGGLLEGLLLSVLTLESLDDDEGEDEEEELFLLLILIKKSLLEEFKKYFKLLS